VLIRVAVSGLLLIALGAEVIGVGGWLAQEMGRPLGLDLSLTEVVGLHAAAAAAGWLSLRVLKGPTSGPALGLLAFIVSLAVPVMGLPALVVVAVAQRSRPLSHDAVAEQTGEGVDEEIEAKEVKPLEDVVRFLLGEVSVEPLADLITSDDPKLRRAAVDILRQLKNPTSIRLMRQALRDPNPDVRVQASSALNKVDKEMTEALEAASKRVAKEPDNLEALITEAETILAYVRSGLLDAESCHHYLKLAAAPVLKVLRLDRDSAQALDLWGQTALLDGRPRRAQTAFKKILATNNNSLSALLGLAEALYDQGRFEELPQACSLAFQLADSKGVDSQAMEAVEMWIP